MSNSPTLSDRLYTYLKTSWEETHVIPTQRQMAQQLETSLSTINDALSILEAQGRIIRHRYKKRGIELIAGQVETDEHTDEVFAYIRQQVIDGKMPTQSEIADALYLSRREVRRCLTVLKTLDQICELEDSWGYTLVEG